MSDEQIEAWLGWHALGLLVATVRLSAASVCVTADRLLEQRETAGRIEPDRPQCGNRFAAPETAICNTANRRGTRPALSLLGSASDGGVISTLHAG
jgi:hypothetical protein